MESLQVALENVVSTAFDGSNDFGRGSPEVQVVLHGIFEGLTTSL